MFHVTFSSPSIRGQSTRPGAVRVSETEELARIAPVVQALAFALRETSVAVSIDTFYASVEVEALARGGDMINDVSGGAMDPRMLPAMANASHPAPYVLMHMRGDPSTMQSPHHTRYGDAGVCDVVADELAAAATRAVDAGIEPWRLWIDPGLGFSKTTQGSWELLRGLGRVRRRLITGTGVVDDTDVDGDGFARRVGCGALRNAPLLIGASRKRFLGSVLGKATAATERDAASAAACVAAVWAGADVVRVHNVEGVCDAMRVADKVWRVHA